MEQARQGRSRRLAAIVHGDAAGFSMLMGADEAGTQAALAAAMTRAREIFASHDGRVVGTAGDAFLAEFASVVDAMAAAVAFQEAMADDPAPAGREPRLTFRIGINLGGVIA